MASARDGAFARQALAAGLASALVATAGGCLSGEAASWDPGTPLEMESESADGSETGASTGATSSADTTAADTTAGDTSGSTGDSADNDGAPPDAMPNFTLEDVNTASISVGRDIEPRDFLGRASAWYFMYST